MRWTTSVLRVLMRLPKQTACFASRRYVCSVFPKLHDREPIFFVCNIAVHRHKRADPGGNDRIGEQLRGCRWWSPSDLHSVLYHPIIRPYLPVIPQATLSS